MKRVFLQIALMLCPFILTAGEVTLIDQNFGSSKYFSPQKFGRTGNSETVDGSWNPIDGKNFSIVADAAYSGGQALCIRRVTPANCYVISNSQAPAKGDSRIELHIKPGALQKSAFSVRFNDSARKRAAFITFQPGGRIFSVIGKDRQLVGSFRADVMQVFEFIIPPKGKHAKMRIYLPGQAKGEFKIIPIEEGRNISTILISNAPDGKCDIIVDKVRLFRGDSPSVLLKSNLAPTAKVTVKDGNGSRVSQKINDGRLRADMVEVLRGLPGVIELELPQPQSVSALRIYSGIAEYLQYPSKDLSVTSYKVEVFSTAAGKWREIDIVSDAPTAKNLTDSDEQRFSHFDFPAIEITKLRITVLKSNDTGKRAHSVNPPVSAVIREVEFFTSGDNAQDIRGLAKSLAAEFRLAVYRDQKKADLHAVLDANVKSLAVEISMRDRNNGFIPMKPRTVTLKPEKNVIEIDISKFPNGEFRTLIRSIDKKSGVFGEFARLLRIDRIPATQALVMPVDFAGKRMYFPDFRYAEKHSGLVCRTFPPENYPQKQAFIEPEQFVQLGGAIGFDKSGNLVMQFTDRNWAWKNIKTRYAVSSFPEINWKVQNERPEGFKPEWHAITRLQCRDYSTGYRFYTAEQKKGKTFRFYDPAKDGKPDLRQIRVIHTGYQPQDWGIIKVKPQATWVLWQKSKNEFVIMHRKPFLNDGISGDEFEDPENTNDNFAGQWVAEDGKTLFYVRGRMLRRYPPFSARYDNLWMGARIQAIFFTQDGINFKRSYFLPPDESDPPTGQQYGASIYKTPQGNGLMIAYLLPYSALHQQYYPELVYSWDGVRWNRFAGNPAWIPAGKPGEWNFGLLNLHNNILARNNKYYHVIGWACAVPHCHAEIRRLGAKAKITAEAIRKSFQPRNLENWPHFKHYGSWEKLAEAWRNNGSHCGVSVYRQDGWFGVTTVAEKTGTLTTCEVQSSQALSANIEVKAGGYCKISAVDANGKVLMQKKLPAGTDSVSAKIFDKLPAGKFRLVIEMKQTILYSLNF